MKNKAFTLSELLGVIIILSILTMLAVPSIVKLMEDSKKEKYISDAKSISSKAIYMYKLEQYRKDSNYFDEEGKIYFNKIKDIKIDKDPFGYVYDQENSYIKIQNVKKEKELGYIEKKVTIYLKSCDEAGKCYYICNVEKDKLNASMIKKTCKLEK